ncbi:hypothetical protein Fmac_026587 [Flemingia macrophylla]|uniref:WRKY domain-containing protein n=1 Tax=Flemingia macrophylla TaxID=520843 RepID=A0ABD1LFJ3_9FABA
MEEDEARVTHSPLTSDEPPPIVETLALRSSLPRDHVAHMQQGSSNARKGAKAENKELTGPLVEAPIVKDAVEAPQKQKENKLQVSVCSASLYELSPTSVSQSLSSGPSPTVPEQGLSALKANSVQVLKVGQRIPFGSTALSSVSIARESGSDGYNWRKYGQKQVKSPVGSRSYYRCTHSNCSAKKIRFCDHSGNVIEIVYKSQHTHEPPHKIDFSKESKLLPSSAPKLESSALKQSIRVLNVSNPSSPPTEPLQEAHCSVYKNLGNSSNGENDNVILKEEHANDPKPKRRLDKGDLTCMDSAVKPGKKPKSVVSVAQDEGISGDGYRWRKYGQKLVKGNPYIRNYYRCTSSGCPVRKHVETAVDNSEAPTVTYKGLHDHDKPVPKKRHGPPGAPHVAAAAPASMKNLESRQTGLLQNQETSAECSDDAEEELIGEALDLGGEKAIESARALLSIGFEIKPC